MPRKDPFFYNEPYDYVERCIHGVPLDFDCDECRLIRKDVLKEDFHDQWWYDTDYGTPIDAEIEDTEERYPEW